MLQSQQRKILNTIHVAMVEVVKYIQYVIRLLSAMHYQQVKKLTLPV